MSELKMCARLTAKISDLLNRGQPGSTTAQIGMLLLCVVCAGSVSVRWNIATLLLIRGLHLLLLRASLHAMHCVCKHAIFVRIASDTNLLRARNLQSVPLPQQAQWEMEGREGGATPLLFSTCGNGTLTGFFSRAPFAENPHPSSAWCSHQRCSHSACVAAMSYDIHFSTVRFILSLHCILLSLLIRTERFEAIALVASAQWSQ